MGRLSGKTCRLLTMLSMTFSFFLVELIVGHVTNSLALVGDSYHMLSDVVALVVGVASVKISKLHSQKNTYGWARAEVLGALVNSVFLVALCFTIFVEAIEKLSEPVEGTPDHALTPHADWAGGGAGNLSEAGVNGSMEGHAAEAVACWSHVQHVDLMLYVGIAGLGVNLIGLLLFHQHSHGHSHGGGGHSHGGGGHSHGGSGHSHSGGHSHGGGGGSKNHAAAEGAGGCGGCDGHGATANHSHGGSAGPVLSAENVALHDVTKPRPSTPSRGGDTGDESSESECEFADAGDGVVVGEGCAEQDGGRKKKSNARSLNMRAVFLHVLGDALGSVGVIVSALVIRSDVGDWKYKVDPVMSMIMVIIIFSTSIPLLKESAFILLQTVPTHIQVAALKDKLLHEVEGVLAVHEFHVWQLAGNRIIASAHIRCQTPHEYMRIAEEVKIFFHNEGIHSTTVQPEFVEFEEISSDRDCVLECGPDKTCYPDTCCARKSNGTAPSELRERLVGGAGAVAEEGGAPEGGGSLQIDMMGAGQRVGAEGVAGRDEGDMHQHL